MNLLHQRLCRSDRWAAYVQGQLMPWVLDGLSLGSTVLELGPGPGRTTEWLARRVDRLTAAEIDPQAADALRRRLADVEVLVADATALPVGGSVFDTVLSFTMLHHVPSSAAQDAVFGEAFRVLRPGGVFAGSDGTVDLTFRLIHLFDTLVPLDPATLPRRLGSTGFTDVRVDTRGRRLRFHARKPRAREQSPT